MRITMVIRKADVPITLGATEELDDASFNEDSWLVVLLDPTSGSRRGNLEREP